MIYLKESENQSVGLNLFQSLDFIFHFHLSGSGVELRQPFTLSWMLHLQLETLQIFQLSAKIINQLQKQGGDQRKAPNSCSVTGQVRLVGRPYLLHGFFFLLEFMAVVPELIHDLPVEVHLILQSQTGVFQLVCHPLLLLQGKKQASVIIFVP